MFRQNVQDAQSVTKIFKADLIPFDFRCILPDADETVTGIVLAESAEYYAVRVIDDLLPDDFTLLSRRAFEKQPDATRSQFYTEMLQASFPDGLTFEAPVPLVASGDDWLTALGQSGVVFGMEWMGEAYRVVRILGRSTSGWHLEEIHYDGRLEDFEVDNLSTCDVLTVGGRYLQGVQAWLTSKALAS